MRRERFEQLIQAAIATVPAALRSKMNNVAFVVEPHQRSAQRHERLIKRNTILLGLYEGVPLTARGSGYQWVLPDKITIFQDAIEGIAGPDEKDVQRIVQETVWHEIAHHFGFNEHEVRRWESRRRSKSQ